MYWDPSHIILWKNNPVSRPILFRRAIICPTGKTVENFFLQVTAETPECQLFWMEMDDSMSLLEEQPCNLHIKKAPEKPGAPQHQHPALSITHQLEEAAFFSISSHKLLQQIVPDITGKTILINHHLHHHFLRLLPWQVYHLSPFLNLFKSVAILAS